MYGEMMEYYGLTKDLNKAEFFETDELKRILTNMDIAIHSGGIIALTAIVGVGKTTALRQIQQSLANSNKDNKVTVAKALATDKRRVNINTLYTALFSDLATAIKDKDFKFTTQLEKRERKLQDLIRKHKKPIALFIDEAHDLNSDTLKELKRLVETVEDAQGVIAIVVVGHPKLANELRKPKMEEVGARAKIFNLDGMGHQKQQYIEWVLDKCSKPKTKPHDIVTKEAVALLADRLITPLQMTHYLSLAFLQGLTTGTKPISSEIIESVLSPDLNAIEAMLARHGYSIAMLCEYLNAKRSEVIAYLKGQLAPSKAEEFNKEILKLGII